MVTKTKLSTKAYCIPSLKLDLLPCSGLGGFSTTNTRHRCTCILSSRKNGNKVYGRIWKRSNDGLLVVTIIPLRECSNMNTMYCITSNQTMQAMRTWAAISDTDMLWHHRMAHLDMLIVREMIQRSQYGIKPIDKKPSWNLTACDQTKRTKSAWSGILIGSSEDITIHDYLCEPMQSTTYRRINIS